MSSASLNADGPLQGPQNRGTAQPYRAEAHLQLAPRPRQFVNFTGEEFPAVAETSKQGKYPVLRYPIPDQTLSYTFEHLRTTTQGRVVYRCTGCRKLGKTTSVGVVNGTHLVGNPETLPHECQPWRSAKEKVDRMFYKKCHDIPKDRNFANIKPIQVYQDMAHEVFSSDVADGAERDDLLSYFSRDQGYKQRRSALWRAKSKLRDSRVTMENVPREYACLADGSQFLHMRTSYILFDEECGGMFALVADGVHNLQPKATNKTGQLYVIHGVLANSMDIPLLFAITVRKNVRTYEAIYGKLKEIIAEAGGRLDLRIIVDFEKAAINAAKRKLGEILGSKYPPMADLILALQGCAITARGILLNFGVRRMVRRRQPRTLRRRDRRRRDRIEKEMARFKALWDRYRGFLRTGTINTYCRKMSRYVSEKVI
ncbi:hypothetical protein GCK32_005735 [Trichostrongylus colubriformis]|uniref:MULE transposase domain-containing protein n=1 Tax=Trichostrongylus colubriformis TaxID=6319 RepID=A0AAN8G5C0_TRICO